MKILSIRGADLASLAGEFTVDFTAPPLDRAGLFAIAGPTGSGKSTLLDALCLALFDRMPRLPEDRGHLVGPAGDDALRVRSTDPRGVLRRGAGEGWAEVVFEGVDGRRYRARWEVRRARRKPTGRFQDVTVRLEDLDSGERLGDTKTDTLALISERLGLTFDQFRRSVLLAQGDFAAFLKAGGKDRAELLERVTGTGLYAELSRASYQRAVEERQALDQLEQRLGEVAPLDEDGRRRLEEELAGGRSDLKQAAERRAEARRANDWHDRRDDLDRAVAEAREAKAAALSRWEEAAPRRSQLERVQSVQELRVLLERADEAAALAERQREAEEQAATTADAAGRTAEERLATARAAAAELADARAAMEAARPQLSRARALDVRLKSAAERRAAAEGEESALRERAEAAAERLERVSGERKAVQGRAAAAGEWLSAHGSLEPVAAQWGRWQAELERLVRARGELERAAAELEDVQAERARFESEAASTREEATRAAAVLGEAEAELASARAVAAEGPDEGELRRRRRTAEARRERLRRAAEVARLAASADDERARLEVQRAELVARAEANERTRHRLENDATAVRGALAEARRAYELALAAGGVDVKALREALVAGVPCPVCGAVEHPWHDSDAAGALAAAQGVRVAELEERATTLAGELGRVAARRAESEERLRELADRGDELESGLVRAAETWEELAAELGLQQDLASVTVGEIEAALDEVHSKLAEVEAEEEAAARLRARLDAARSRVEGARAAHGEAAERATALAERRRAADDARAGADSRAAQARAAADEALEALAGPLEGVSGWREAAAASPRGLADALARDVEAWRERAGVRAEAEAAERELAVAEATAGAEAEHGARALGEAHAAASAAREEHERLAAERAGVLEGRGADEVEAECAAAVGEAERRAETTRAEASTAEREHAVALRDLESRRAAVAAAAEKAAAAEAELAAGRRSHGLDADELRRLLQHPRAWIEEESAALSVLEREVADRAAVLDQQRRLLRAHEAADRPPLDAAAARAAAEVAEEEWEAAHGGVARLEERIAEDDRRRARAAELREQVVKQAAATRVWEELRELIGSADGSKLRVFAQSLTLDVLLGHANRHLEELARRYRLERVPGAELELQVVDRDLGDEVRSVHSLSGGETFLVSLALALGLASLSSRRTRVDSLFIDEGFGSLDADTLDAALATLDALQAQGRTVGVISHVPTMVERIGLQVKVTPRGGGRSAVEVLPGGGSADD